MTTPFVGCSGFKKNKPFGLFFVDPRVICRTAEGDFHLRLHAEVAEGEPAKNLGVVVAGDGVDVFNVDVLHSVYSFREWLSCLFLDTLY